MSDPNPINPADAVPAAIRIFRPGTFTSTEGVQVSFGAAELQAIADAYDPSADPAPLVIGHPRLDDPAYGWVGALAVEDGALVAQPSRVEPSFAETVRAGRYAKVSAQFYAPNHPANPKPGTHYLKHVGFLGAHAPGVKGLGTVSLADGEAGSLITIDFDTAKETHVSDPEKKGELSFAERTAALDEREAAIAKREADALAARRKASHAANLSFAEAMVTDAKLAPAGKGLLVGLLDALDDDEGVRSFGEADADKMPPAAALKKLLSGAQPLVSLGEIAGADKKAGADDPIELARKARAFAETETAAGRPTNVVQAVRHLSKGA